MFTFLLKKGSSNIFRRDYSSGHFLTYFFICDLFFGMNLFYPFPILLDVFSFNQSTIKNDSSL